MIDSLARSQSRERFYLGNSLSRYGLAIHTSSPQLGLALDNREGDRVWRTWDLDRAISNYFHQYLTDTDAPKAIEKVRNTILRRSS